MQTFEEKLTAWIDGRLSGVELQRFEAELASNPEALSGKEDAHRLGDLLRKEYRAPELRNADFFNHQLLQRIAAETQHREEPVETAPAFWPLWRMAWAGGLSLIIAGVLFYAVVRPGPSPAPAAKDLLAQVLDANTADPGVTASSFQSKADSVTVLWLDGLDYIPADYVLE